MLINTQYMVLTHHPPQTEVFCMSLYVMDLITLTGDLVIPHRQMTIHCGISIPSAVAQTL